MPSALGSQVRTAMSSDSILRSTSTDTAAHSVAADAPFPPAPRFGANASTKRDTVDVGSALSHGGRNGMSISPVSLAALKEEAQPSMRPEVTYNYVETSNSDASEATLTVGTAELLLFQTTPSCHASPLVMSAAAGAPNTPLMWADAASSQARVELSKLRC